MLPLSEELLKPPAGICCCVQRHHLAVGSLSLQRHSPSQIAFLEFTM